MSCCTHSQPFCHTCCFSILPGKTQPGLIEPVPNLLRWPHSRQGLKQNTPLYYCFHFKFTILHPKWACHAAPLSGCVSLVYSLAASFSKWLLHIFALPQPSETSYPFLTLSWRPWALLHLEKRRANREVPPNSHHCGHAGVFVCAQTHSLLRECQSTSAVLPAKPNLPTHLPNSFLLRCTPKTGPFLTHITLSFPLDCLQKHANMLLFPLFQKKKNQSSWPTTPPTNRLF